MRLYVPATVRDLDHPDGLAPLSAHASTPALAAALPGEDAESLEYAALLAAADESVALLAADPGAPRRRVVVAADVPGALVPAGPLPSGVAPPAHVPWSRVVSLHVDDADAVPDVTAAALGDDDALDRAAEHDLLWYDVTELAAVRALPA